LRLATLDPEKYQASPVAEDYILFATGDGRQEDRVCKGFTEHFNGTKINILSFKSPLPRRTTGLASVGVVKTYIERFPVKRLLWTCDKEHLKASNSWMNQVKDSLASIGITSGVGSEWKDAARLELAVGPKRVVLWCALTGVKKALEENLSELIELELKEKVLPNKKEISSALTRHGLKIEDLIKHSSKKNLRLATPSLVSVFEDIEQFCSSAT
jgi:hypothetical protein